MKIKTIRQVYHIISEPGDNTRYDYFVTNFGDTYMFLPYESTFKFPQKLNYWEVKDIESMEDLDDYKELLKEHVGVNPWTLMECIRTLKELQNEEV